MSKSWRELGPPPLPDDPRYAAWVKEFNAEADAWAAECEAKDSARDSLTEEFLQIAKWVQERSELYRLESPPLPIGPPTFAKACESAILDVWFCIDRLRYSEYWQVAYYRNLCDFHLSRLSDFFSAAITESYYLLLQEEVTEAEKYALERWESIMRG